MIGKKNITSASTWLVNKKQISFNLSIGADNIFIFVTLLSSWVVDLGSNLSSWLLAEVMFFLPIKNEGNLSTTNIILTVKQTLFRYYSFLLRKLKFGLATCYLNSKNKNTKMKSNNFGKSLLWKTTTGKSVSNKLMFTCSFLCYKHLSNTAGWNLKSTFRSMRELNYLTRAIISCCLYFFYPIFHCG